MNVIKLAIFGVKNSPVDLLSSKLLNEETFYPVFLKDLKRCKSEVIIECPFVTTRRLNQLSPTLEKLKARRVRIVINTRDPQTNDDEYRKTDSHDALSKLQHLGIHVLYTKNHHRKLAIIDRTILYEGSLNVLSQYNSSGTNEGSRLLCHKISTSSGVI